MEKSSPETLEMHTKLSEIFSLSKEEIDATIQPLFEDLRSKYSYLYKTDPKLIVKVPYSVILFGDNITKLHKNKIVANLDKSLIVFYSKSESKRLNIKYFDKVDEICVDVNETLQKKDVDSINKYMVQGYLYGLKNALSENQNKINEERGANIMVFLNSTNYNSHDQFITAYLAAFLAALSLFSENFVALTKDKLYEMVTLSLTESTELDISFYGALVYYKIFLKENSIGFDYNNKLLGHKIYFDSKQAEFNLLIFDSLSAEPIKYYKNTKFWGKRKLEVKFGLLIIMKNYKGKITDEELNLSCGSVGDFLRGFDNNFESAMKVIETYLKKEAYSIGEIKEILGDNLDVFLKDFDSNCLNNNKSFNCYQRIYYIFSELKRIQMLFYKVKISDLINWSDEFKESGTFLQKLYEAYSEEIIFFLNFLSESKSNKLSVKLLDEGWKGRLCVLGEETLINEYKQRVLNKLETLLNDESRLVSAWISDDISNYCYKSKLGRGLSLMDPRYEDFMLEHLKQKNNLGTEYVKVEGIKEYE